MRRYFTPLSIPLDIRFWAKVDKDGPLPDERPELGPCWLWTGFIDRAGYGRIRLGGRSSPVGYAHVVALELAGVTVPPGYDRDHLCRRRHCCRADHLEPVPHLTNALRGASPQVLLHLAGVCARGHEANDDNVYRRKDTGRIVYCRPCRLAQRREASHRKRVAESGDSPC
jgi:hypothetical protein